MVNMWSCFICSHETSRRGNIIRHITLVHAIEDKEGKNASRETNKAAGMTSYGEDRLGTPGIPTYEGDRMEILACLNGFKQQSEMFGRGIPMSEERYLRMNSPERMLKLQDGGHYNELARHHPRMEENEDSEEDSEKDSEGDKRYQLLPNQEHTEEEIDKIYGDLKAKKGRILDCLLKTIPDHLKTKAKRICDDLKSKDRLFILPGHEINIDGKTLRGSHIRRLVLHELLKPPRPGCIQYKVLEQENITLKWLLNHFVKAYEHERGALICRKFESLLDGTVEYFDDESDESSGDGDDKDEKDSDKNEEEGDEDETGDSDDSEDASDEDEDSINVDDESIPKKRRRNFKLYACGGKGGGGRPRRVHTQLNELEALKKVKNFKEKRNRIIDDGGMDLVYCICDCVHNMLNGNIPLKYEEKKRLERHKDCSRELIKKKTSDKKRKHLIQEGGCFGALIPTLVTLVGKMFSGQ